MSSLDALIALAERAELGDALRVASLVAARLSPLVWLSPLLSLRNAPAIVRTGLLLGLTAAMLPFASAHARAPDALDLHGLLLVREGLIGSLFALVTAVPAYALDTAGRLVDVHRGASAADVIAPPTGERTSPLADLFLLGTLAVFASVGGIRLTLGVLATSFADLPVGVVPARGLGMLALDAAHALGFGLALAAAFAAPAGVAIVVAEAALGLVSRSVPRISVFFLGMPLRALLGIALVLVALPLVVQTSLDAFRDALAHASRMLR